MQNFFGYGCEALSGDFPPLLFGRLFGRIASNHFKRGKKLFGLFLGHCIDLSYRPRLGVAKEFGGFVMVVAEQ